jgi:shikimate kinase
VKKNLVLLGMMAVGKTTLGKIVAKKQELKFVDIDANIETKNSMTIKEIFKKKGENFFRMEEEKEVLKSLKKSNCIIALGGGAFMNKTVRENILKNAISIWLNVDLKTLNKRIKWNKKRPLLKEENNQKKLIEIACDNLSKQTIAEKIIALYEKY